MAAIIFDFDGTIADSFEAAVQIFYQLSGHHEALPSEEIEHLRGLSLLHAAEELHVHPWKLPFLLARGRRRMARQIDSVKIQTGMPELIRKLHAQGHQLFIISSNSTKNIQKFLKNNGLSDYFEAICGGAGLLKKSRFIKKLIKRNRLDPAAIWYVGDETRDISAAHEAGLPIVSVTWGYNTAKVLAEHKPDQLAETPAQLLKLLQ